MLTVSVRYQATPGSSHANAQRAGAAGYPDVVSALTARAATCAARADAATCAARAETTVDGSIMTRPCGAYWRSCFPSGRDDVMHAEAWQWLTCTPTGRRRADCHQVHELGNAQRTPVKQALDANHRSVRTRALHIGRTFAMYLRGPTSQNILLPSSVLGHTPS